MQVFSALMPQAVISAVHSSSKPVCTPHRLPPALQVLRARCFAEVKPQPTVHVAAPREVAPNMAALVAGEPGLDSHSITGS